MDNEAHPVTIGHIDAKDRSEASGSPAGAATLADRQAINDAISGLLDGIDRRDWTIVGSHLAEQVKTDYTSLFAGSPRTQTAAELVDSWRSLVPGFDATQHLTGTILADVSGDTARARCAVTAVHRIGKDCWTPSGHYEIELLRTGSHWVIGAIVCHNVFVAGDKTLPEKAQARARGASHIST